MMKSAAAGKGMMVGSSPGRAEKLPAPGLARLLGGGGRSRGRSGVARTSPMFGTRSRSVGRQAGAEARAGEEGEPSSPKVTCIGQVRIRNKNKKKSDTRTSKSRERLPTAAKRCPCPQRSLLCCVFVCRQKGSGGQPWWSLWWRQRWSSLRSGKSGRYQQRKSIERNEVDLMKPPIEMVGGGGGGGGRGGGYFESDREGYRDDDEDEEEQMENEEEEETRVFMSSATTTPPKNALLLMRCRSAPHNRSSSLAANRFPVSPLPPSESGSSPAEKEAGKKIEEREEEEEEGGRSSNGSSRDGEEGSRPLVLTRCKSEPARKVAVRDASNCFRANNDGDGGGDGGGRQRRLALVHEERPLPPLSPPR